MEVISMTLIRWAPDADVDTLSDQVERLLAGVLNTFGGVASRTPPVDVRRDGNSLEIEAAVPGFSPDEITVTADNGRLAIDAQKKAEAVRKEESFVRRERFVGRLYREMPLPDAADIERVNATLENGILRITVPVSENAEPKRIQVSASPKLEKSADTRTEQTSAGQPASRQTNGRTAEPAGAGAQR
jgi:HSP20 family protein